MRLFWRDNHDGGRYYLYSEPSTGVLGILTVQTPDLWTFMETVTENYGVYAFKAQSLREAKDMAETTWRLEHGRGV